MDSVRILFAWARRFSQWASPTHLVWVTRGRTHVHDNLPGACKTMQSFVGKSAADKQQVAEQCKAPWFIQIHSSWVPLTVLCGRPCDDCLEGRDYSQLCPEGCGLARFGVVRLLALLVCWRAKVGAMMGAAFARWVTSCTSLPPYTTGSLSSVARPLRISKQSVPPLMTSLGWRFMVCLFFIAARTPSAATRWTLQQKRSLVDPGCAFYLFRMMEARLLRTS